MNLDKDSNMPLYLQLKKIIIDMIRSGELKPGDPMKTEAELCEEYGISRFPVRQAMGELVEEGYLSRTRGRGTFINEELPSGFLERKNKLLGLVLNHLTTGFNGQILSGFEKQARRRGYLTAACSTDGSWEEELNCIARLEESNANGIVVFPCDDSKLAENIGRIMGKGIYVGLVDRNPGISDVDYTGSDNRGGAYAAVRHIAMQGFRNIAFITGMPDVSSIKERLDGYLKAVEDYNLNAVTQIDIKEETEASFHYTHKFYVEKFRDELAELKKHVPLGVFAINDFIAAYCISVFREEGLILGKDVAVVGFDNAVEREYPGLELTSVAQNGLLLGQSAADIAIDKIEGRTNQIYRSIIPTQLVVRNSCGEKG